MVGERDVVADIDLPPPGASTPVDERSAPGPRNMTRLLFPLPRSSSMTIESTISGRRSTATRPTIRSRFSMRQSRTEARRTTPTAGRALQGPAGNAAAQPGANSLGPDSTPCGLASSATHLPELYCRADEAAPFMAATRPMHFHRLGSAHQVRNGSRTLRPDGPKLGSASTKTATGTSACPLDPICGCIYLLLDNTHRESGCHWSTSFWGR